MKNITKYLIEVFLHLKYGELFLTERFSLKFPYYYIQFNQQNKEFVFVTDNEIKSLNEPRFYFFKICILGFGFSVKFFKNK